jgi:hypothetical protein
MVKVSKGNTKIGDIMNFSLPAGITCNPDAPCFKKGCYANKGTFKFSNVQNRYRENLDSYLENPAQAEKDLLNQLPAFGYFRLHVSGDFINEEYLEMWVSIAKKIPGLKILAFTKKYDLINQRIASKGRLPSNLKIVFSSWPGLEVDNWYNLPTADVQLKNELKPGYKCPGKCNSCFYCWNMVCNQKVVFDFH